MEDGPCMHLVDYLETKECSENSSNTVKKSKSTILLFSNNLDELFMLMHFLDAGKFGSLEEFQQEFADISQEEQVSRLHKMLAPHLLRRLKKDVMTELPPKKELILRVELSSEQKEYYKAILTRNFQTLTRKGSAQISLINVVMELRKLCCHPFMLEGVEPEDNDEFNKCVVCEQEAKVNDHLFLHCKATMSLCNMFLCLLGVNWMIPNTMMELLSSWKGIGNKGRKKC
ncbi:hypothetical protein H5410_041277 [Solanum commersonii]|uniref:SNF2 N-terminal domain-containing protein n=1 Tax=Solanum commersonii TaxID=4109 RepID=A0A9J5XR46_SOLCO|nr:hypothetical protein H5410_041277 [Solanum commersonii]